MVLGVVVLLAFVLVYPTLHAYIAQRAALATLDAQVAAAQQQNDDLQNDLQRWQDPAYVTSQARERLAFVLPGERAYRVVDPETVQETPTASDGPAGAVQDTTSLPWYTSVWQSVEVAGEAAAG
ncbi:MAG: septum formation initiator family protein [Actinobacteria bacterium]|nr:septum formation initiator family protein [Actinomycetota bacterium]